MTTASPLTGAALGYRKIWFYSAPGSGVPWWVGPPFDTGEWCKSVLHINHQPVGYPIGGYLGLMGGDPGLSYNDVITDEGNELARLLSINPDLPVKPADGSDYRWEPGGFELWFCAYSQAADGMEDALVRLFGDGGPLQWLRPAINGSIMFGNPSRQPGPTRVGNNPPGWGISRKPRPAWLEALTWSITAETPNGPDMYACTQDGNLLPLFYEWFVKANTTMTFAAYTAGIIIPAIVSYIPFAEFVIGPILAGAAGLGLDFIQELIQGFGGNAAVSPNPELVNDLSAQGLLTPQGIVQLIATLAALPGIQTHGSYYDPHAEFGGRTGVQVAQDIVASFRR